MSETLKKSVSKTKIRWLIRQDLPSILKIENESFISPWNEEEFIEILRDKNCIGLVCEVDGEIAGFLFYDKNDSLYEILNLAVLPEKRLQGIGKKLISHLMKKMETSRNTTEILATVSEWNLNGHLFFSKLNFQAEMVTRNFYGPDHDGYNFLLHKFVMEEQLFQET